MHEWKQVKMSFKHQYQVEKNQPDYKLLTSQIETMAWDAPKY